MRTENTPVLKTERLLLRRFTDEDTDSIFSLFGDEEVNTFLPWFPLRTRAEAAAYLHEHILPLYQKEAAYYYAISLEPEGKVIGYIHLSDIGGSSDMGYALQKEFWHRGIASEASAALVGHLRQVGLPFITATHDVRNPHSGGVMRHVGMTYRYSYREQWQPKDIPVVFRMYQLNLDGVDRTYTGYQEKYPWFVEEEV